MRSWAVTVPSPFASIGSVDVELELVEDVLLVPLVLLLVEEVASDDFVESALPMSDGGPPAGGAPGGGP